LLNVFIAHDVIFNNYLFDL